MRIDHKDSERNVAQSYQPKPSKYRVTNFTKTPEVTFHRPYNPMTEKNQSTISLNYVNETSKVSPLKSFVKAMMEIGRNIERGFRKFFRLRKNQ